MESNYIALSIPVFFILIGIEISYSFYKKLGYYRLNDSISNLSQGTGQQVLDVFMKSAVFFGYYYIFNHWRFFTIEQTWYTWLILFIGADFFYYWFHRMSHQVNILWAAHIVHHQSEEYNLTVALRQSWIQGWFSWIFYLPLAFVGFNPIMFLTVSSFITLYQFWIHTRSIRSLGFLEHIINTPSHHRVHHGSNAEYIDKNHAGTLIIWDKLFGTFQKEEADVYYGITKPLNSWNPVWANVHYWKELLDMSLKMPRWSDKIAVFLKPPGWVPDNSGTPVVSGVQVPSKYNPNYSSWIPPYVLFQFIIGLVAGVFLIFFNSTLSMFDIVFCSLFIYTTLICCGALLENKKWIYFLETARIVSGLFVIPILNLSEVGFFCFFLFIIANLIWYLFISLKK